MVDVGDRVRVPGDGVGVVVHLSPPVLRLDAFHCYVLFEPERARLLERRADPSAAVRTAVLDRIKRYISAASTAAPTAAPTGG